MRSVEIVPVRRRSQRLAFARLPRRLQGSDPRFVPPLVPEVLRVLDPRRNPFFGHGEAALFLARREGAICGRVSAASDRFFDEYQGERVGWFGHLEAVEDAAVLRALLDAARAFARERGAEVLRGPVNLSTNYECGLLVEGFDSPPAVGMNHNPRYLGRLLEEAGLRPAKDLLAYWLWNAPEQTRRVARLAERLASRSPYAVRPIRMKHFAAEVSTLHGVYERSWERNWGFAPLPLEEFRFLANGMKRILDPDFCLLAEREGEAVGFLLALPDANRAIAAIDGRLFPFGLFRLPGLLRRIRNVRVVTLGVLPEHRGRGADAALIATLVRHAETKGVVSGEMSWVLEDNLAMRRPIEALGGRVYKRYRIYEEALRR
ncbi:MAG TPA: GNAT family N-acetyltransferase [Planctomycetota bacterium]|nr:GNAT family N-acetyltransferase [Planctomycetota bacterium]